jgi:hypothetical protein
VRCGNFAAFVGDLEQALPRAKYLLNEEQYHNIFAQHSSYIIIIEFKVAL